MILHGLGGSLAEDLVVLQVRKQRRGRRLAREQGEDDDKKKKTVRRKKKSTGGPYPAIPPRGINLHVPRVVSQEPLTTTVAAIALHLQRSHHPPPNHTRATEQEAVLSLPHAPHRSPAAHASISILKKYFAWCRTAEETEAADVAFGAGSRGRGARGSSQWRHLPLCRRA